MVTIASDRAFDSIGSTEILQMFISNRPGRVRHGTSGKTGKIQRSRLREEAQSWN